MEKPWKRWRGLADGTQKAAMVCEDAEQWRSAVSRHYYAAYQAVSALLLYQGLTVPVVAGERREAWSHASTPELWGEVLRKFVPSAANRNDLVSRLAKLYKLRVDADYISVSDVSAGVARQTVKDAGYIIKVVDTVLPPRTRK